MLPLAATEFARLCGGRWCGNPEAKIYGFATDSRQVKHGDLFIAIPGARVDGHDYVQSALEKGASACLVEQPAPGPCIKVEKIESALALFGQNVRKRFEGPVVGVTGSAGKTTTKEFLAAALESSGPVLKSQGNKNTEFTSPLLWARLAPETRFVVVEMAMRGFGQIAHLAAISSPNLGLITNIGYSHLLQVGSRAGIAKAKGEIIEALPADGTAVIWREDDFHSELLALAGRRRTCTFGFSEGADCRITHYRPMSLAGAEVSGTCFGALWRASLPAAGKHIALDAAAALLAASVCGCEVQLAADALQSVELPPMRMEIRNVNGATVLLDTYNASPPSMLSAIESVSESPAEGRRLAILGQMLELGDATEEAHAGIGKAVNHSHFDQVLFVGDAMRHACDQQDGSVPSHMVDDERELRDFVAALEPGDVLLVKGSRALKLEKIFN
jgi:UDP-N-acetylmuramoyl-tripeptide--D-alanyl-D-alanine ligase